MPASRREPKQNCAIPAQLCGNVDLRESGSIEQDADIVMFIHREDLRYTEEDWERQFPDRPYPQGMAEIMVAKHRNGPTDKLQLTFLSNLTQFRNYARAQ